MLALNREAWIVVAAGLLLGWAATPARAAGDRLAVLIVADQDPDLSDNLTEVAISKLAERRAHRLVGWRELHDQLPDILDGLSIGECLDRPECLARIGAAARAESALLGDVRREADQFVVRLVLVNTRTAVHDAEFSDRAGADIAQLIALVRKGADVVSTPRPAVLTLQPAPAPAQAVTQTGASPTGSPMVTATQSSAHRSRWVTPLGYAAGGLAVVSLSAAVVTGSLATAKPNGATRAEMQSDLERRDRYAGVANSLYLFGGVLAVSAIALLVTQLRHQ